MPLLVLGVLIRLVVFVVEVEDDGEELMRCRGGVMLLVRNRLRLQHTVAWMSQDAVNNDRAHN